MQASPTEYELEDKISVIENMVEEFDTAVKQS